MLYRYHAGGMQREHASGFPCQDSLCNQLLAFVLHRDILQCAALLTLIAAIKEIEDADSPIR